MEKKKINQKLLIIVGVLLLFGSTSLAYFASKVIFNGSGGVTSATTATIRGATVHTEGVLDVDSNILPGHKAVSIVKVTATGNNELIPYNLVWSGTNTFSILDYKVYKTTTRQNVTTTCNTEKTVIDGAQVIGEVCNITNLDKIGNSINEGTIIKNDTKKELTKDEFITATSDGSVVYYYIVIEYKNLDISQNDDLKATINGKIKVEESNTKPDINIVAAYIKQEDGTYEETSDIPQSGYKLNKEKSTCSNGATPTWTSEGLLTSNLTKSGTSCYLYFDEYSASDVLLAYAKENSHGEKTSFGSGATTNEGIYEVDDPMYITADIPESKSYYWRGAVEDNHVIFANYCWRIIRINGDGTIRMIYNGAIQSGNTCLGNGANGTKVHTSTRSVYNVDKNQSYYAGWTWSTKQRPTLSKDANGITVGGNNSTIKTAVESWYKTNITDKGYDSEVAIGKYCNDRNVKSTQSWSANEYDFNYAPFERWQTGIPTLSCESGDTYNVKVGLITADEVIYAGGNGSNTSYYLYSNLGYWTMSPSTWSGTGTVHILYVHSSGNLAHVNASDNTPSCVRPVINLSSSAAFNSGADGTSSHPYIVS